MTPEGDSGGAPCSCSCRCRDELLALRNELRNCRLGLEGSREELKAREQELRACKEALLNASRIAALEQQSRQRPWSSLPPGREAAQDSPAAGPGPLPPDVDPDAHVKRVSEYSLVTDFLPSVQVPLEARTAEIVEIAERNGFRAQVWQFTELEPGETLMEHVHKHIQAGCCSDPSMVPTLKYISSRTLNDLKVANQEEGAKRMASWFRNLAALWSEWQASLKNLLAGIYDPFLYRAVLFGDAGKSRTQAWNIVNWPTIVIGDDGKRYWGMIRQGGPATLAFQLKWSLRDMLIVKHSPVTINTVAADTGALLWQNAASTAMFGCHGLFNAAIGMCGWADGGLKEADAVAAMQQQREQREAGADFLRMLLGSDQEKLGALRSTVEMGKIFCVRVEITDERLRSWMGLQDGDEAHHDVQVTLSSDPITLQRVYTVSQVDVTDVVIAQRQLAEEKQRTEALLERQYELIACLGKVGEIGQSPANNASAAELINGVRRKIAALGLEEQQGGGDAGVGKIEMLELLGEGSYGKVYLGLWRGTIVAIKSMILPFGMSGAEKHERMAIMEAAISASLAHPNVVQTYTYSIQPVRDNNTTSSPDSSGPLADNKRMVSRVQSQGRAAVAANPALQRAVSAAGTPPLLGGGAAPAAAPLAPLNSPSAPLARSAAPAGSSASSSQPDSPTAPLDIAAAAAVGAAGPRRTSFDRPHGQQPRAHGDRPSLQHSQRSVVYAPAGEERRVSSFTSGTGQGAGGGGGEGSGPAPPVVRGLEVRLVLEFCDAGTLRDALDDGAFLVGREVNYLAVLETAADIAKGMLQLHSMNVVHSDLKARNVLLKSNASEARGVSAKIADFGLSFKMDHLETHVSSVFHGTLTHMAPEILLQGCQSKASDVYAFGITLWELYTAGRPFMGVPQALMGHQITREGRRPVFASDAPPGYVQLAQRCWDDSMAARPGFQDILSALLALRAELSGQTIPIKVKVKQANTTPGSSSPLRPSKKAQAGANYFPRAPVPIMNVGVPGPAAAAAAAAAVAAARADRDSGGPPPAAAVAARAVGSSYDKTESAPLLSLPLHRQAQDEQAAMQLQRRPPSGAPMPSDLSTDDLRHTSGLVLTALGSTSWDMEGPLGRQAPMWALQAGRQQQGQQGCSGQGQQEQGLQHQHQHQQGGSEGQHEQQQQHEQQPQQPQQEMATDDFKHSSALVLMAAGSTMWDNGPLA